MYVNPSEVRWASLACDAMEQFYNGARGDDLLRAMRVPLAPNRFAFGTSRSRLVLDCQAVGDGSDVFVFIDGSRTTRGSSDLNDAYGVPPSSSAIPGLNRALAAWAVTVFDAIRPGDWPAPNDVHFISFSAGAGAALSIAQGLFTLLPNLRCDVTTFCSPRLAWRSFGEACHTFAYQRYHSDGDPIGHLPLHSGESPYADFLTTRAFLSNANQYDHVGSGFALSDTGALIPLGNYEAPSAPENPALSLTGWASGLSDEAVAAHSIGRLAMRLRLLVRSSPDLVGPVTYPSGLVFVPTPPALIDPPVYGVRGGRGGNDPVMQALGGLPASVRGDDIARGSVLDRPYYAQKTSGGWWVYYRGQPMFSEANKRSAKRRAGNLNSVIADVRKATSKDQPGLVESVNLETL